MSKLRLLDLFCGAGGAAMGYHRAGFEVVGVDEVAQPNYPFPFSQADAMDVLEWLASGADDPFIDTLDATGFDRDFDAIHASPPCQHYSLATAWRGNRDDHPDLVGPTRELLKATGLPWVLENVPEAPTFGVTPCGSQFGLNVRRHRRFETSWEWFTMMEPCQHYGLRAFEHKQERAYADAMGCEWMNRDEGRQAIPPAYTEFIGAQLIAQLKAEVTT